MFFLGLAVDYDGTIAQDDRVSEATIAALQRVKDSGRRLVLVTGRRLEAVIEAFPQYRLFDRLVVENGAVLHAPADDRTEVLSPAPDPRLVELVRSRSSAPIEVGRSILAGWEPDQAIFLEAVRQLGLEMQIVFNKGALMLLPAGVNKASGLRTAALELQIRTSSFVGIGDAENDHSFLAICGCSCATANAVPSLKREVDIVTPDDHGAGVQWLADQLLQLDRKIVPDDRRGLPIGTTGPGDVLRLSQHGGNVLIVGPSGTGKSSLATLICEAALHRELGYAVIDPEGDYAQLAGASIVDLALPGWGVTDFGALLSSQVNPVLMLRGLPQHQRSEMLALGVAMVLTNSLSSGHPGFLIVDEAHEGLADSRSLSVNDGPCVVVLTLRPELVSSEVLQTIGTVIAFGPHAPRLLAQFARLSGITIAETTAKGPAPPALMWRRGRPSMGLWPYSPKSRHIRHAGKYATGDVGRERSFYFRGPDNRYLVPARNLFEFITVARQLPLEVWSHHLRNGDISRWFNSVIRDAQLAETAATLAAAERQEDASSLEEISHLIGERYCVPPLPVSHHPQDTDAGSTKGS